MQFFTNLFKPKKDATNKKDNKKFRCLERSPNRIKWGGVLPRTPLSDHFVYGFSLENPDSSGRLPDRQTESVTHEIRIGYRLNVGNRALSILHVGQYDFGQPSSVAHFRADKVCLNIALELLDPKTDLRVLLRPDPYYWDCFIERTFKRVLREG